jgi:23S rRNA (guanosine2251-2'-O)-methyltransferase
MPSRLILSGLRSIEECIRANPGRIARLLIPQGRLSPRIDQIAELARKAGIRIETNPKAAAPGEEPLLALMHDYEYSELDDLRGDLRDEISRGNRPVVLMTDGITDPHNLGAILRTAAFMGVDGVVIPKDRSALINETVYRIASGGLEYLRVAQVTNLVAAMQKLKEDGFWSVGFSEHAEKNLSEITPDFPVLIVVGNEEKGIRHLVSQNCDYLARLEGKGQLKSLNASVAAALAMEWATRGSGPSSSDRDF